MADEARRIKRIESFRLYRQSVRPLPSSVIMHRQRTAQADAHLKKLRVAEIAAKIQMVQAESVVVGDSSFT